MMIFIKVNRVITPIKAKDSCKWTLFNGEFLLKCIPICIYLPVFGDGLVLVMSLTFI